MMYEAESGAISIALLGDTIPTRRLSVFQEERFLRIRELLTQADAVFSNLEAPVVRYLELPHAQRPGGGPYMTTEPHLLEDLKWLGINMLACGSTHSDDYGPAGIVRTIELLDRARMVHAGSGRHLAEAQAPAYLETPGGRVALIAALASFNPQGRAGEQRRETAGYPGINALRNRTVYEVDAETLEAARRLGKVIGWDAEMGRQHALGESGGRGGDLYNLLGHTFVLGSASAVRSYANETDVEANVRQIRLAKSMADRVIVSLHSHELGGPSYFTAKTSGDLDEPAEFVLEFAHRCIDAGADVFAGHGPQVPLGIEIYKGKPIFYGLGSFINQLETVRYLPDQAYERYGLGVEATPVDFAEHRYGGISGGTRRWEQAFAICDFAGERIKEIRLHPLELGAGQPRARRGRPLMAEGEVAERIIGRIASLSAKYGTGVEYRDGIGLIRER